MQYNATLVTISVLVAIVAAYTAIDHVERLRGSTKLMQRVWLAVGAICMGGGIWTMHFVGMIAMKFKGFELKFDPWLTLISFLLPIAGTGGAFAALYKWGRFKAIFAGVPMGLAIVSMHYVGMAAISNCVHMDHEHVSVVASIGIAIAASITALWTFTLKKSILLKAVASVLLGFAVSGMHYTAMSGVTFALEPNCLAPTQAGTITQQMLASLAAMLTFIILFGSQVAGLHKDALDEAKNKEHALLMMNELNHRVKNTLATIQSLVRNSLKTCPELEKSSLEGRLLSLSSAHSLLTETNWQPVELRSIITSALGIYTSKEGGPHCKAEGPDIEVPPRVALSLQMVMHELTTNAVKYGSLSTPSGKVIVTWEEFNGGKHDKVFIKWVERGGPPATKPDKVGFGTRLIKASLAELDGTIEKDFSPQGMSADIVISLK